MKYKYYKSDFSLIVSVSAKAQQDGSTINLNAYYPFEFKLFTSRCEGTVFKCSSDGDGGTVNCSIVDESHILIYFDQKNAKLSTGKLMLEANFKIPNAHYEGDGIMNVRRLFFTDIILTDQADLDTDDEDIKIQWVPVVLSAEYHDVENSLPGEIDPTLPMRIMQHNGNPYLPGTSADKVKVAGTGKTVEETLNEKTDNTVFEELKRLVNETRNEKADKEYVEGIEGIVNAEKERLMLYKGIVTNIDSLNERSDTGTYFYLGTMFMGLVCVGWDFNGSITQICLSSATPKYDALSTLSFKVRPTVMQRRYVSGRWTKWEVTEDADLINQMVTDIGDMMGRITVLEKKVGHNISRKAYEDLVDSGKVDPEITYYIEEEQ